MPYVDGPILIAYQLSVPGSRSARGCADFRNSSTSFSFPGFASNCAQIATRLIINSSCESDARQRRLVRSLHENIFSRRCVDLLPYNWAMSFVEQIQKDITAAMKAREEQRLSTLRMVKSALQNRQIEKMAPLDEKESQAVLNTLIKQRKESVEQFTKGGRQEMADKEAAEIVLIESYLPKAAGETEVVAGVKVVIAEMGAPTMKDMGTVMKNVMARFNAAGMRVDGKMVSEAVKRELAEK